MTIANTFGLPATADRYLEIGDVAQLRALFEGAQPPAPYYVIGAASNIVFSRHYPGTIIRLTLRGVYEGEQPFFMLPDDAADSDRFVVAAAGEPWAELVTRCTAQGCYGLENLAAIPGTVGAAPVQNVGAYGREAADVIHSVLAYDTDDQCFRTFSNAECRFAYRDSLFKQSGGRYIVLYVLFRLSAVFVPHLEYRALADALAADMSAGLTAARVAAAVEQLRWSKLPRPEEMGSAGSFFKNPVVDAETYRRLLADYPDLVAFPVSSTQPSTTHYKLSAGWLIERAGWKGRAMGHCGVYERQALVLVNRGGATGDEVQVLADAIIKDVSNIFNIILQPEAIIL